MSHYNLPYTASVHSYIYYWCSVKESKTLYSVKSLLFISVRNMHCRYENSPIKINTKGFRRYYNTNLITRLNQHERAGKATEKSIPSTRGDPPPNKTFECNLTERKSNEVPGSNSSTWPRSFEKRFKVCPEKIMIKTWTKSCPKGFPFILITVYIKYSTLFFLFVENINH